MTWKFQSQPPDELANEGREAFLREQLRAIQSELGEVDTRGDELDEYRLKIEEAVLPPEAHEEALRQIRAAHDLLEQAERMLR